MGAIMGRGVLRSTRRTEPGGLTRPGTEKRDNFGDRIPTLMRQAGFAAASEVAHRVTITGRITYYRAAVPVAESDAAHTAT